MRRTAWRMLEGGAAGAVATAPMTALMTGAFRALPREARRPLPPRVITMNAGAAVHDRLSPAAVTAARLTAR